MISYLCKRSSFRIPGSRSQMLRIGRESPRGCTYERTRIIVLDHALTGALTGLDAAPLFKALAPHVKVILFTGHAELQARADEEPSIDAFLLRTEAMQLLTLAQQLTGLSAR
jgi:hypothetical protein